MHIVTCYHVVKQAKDLKVIFDTRQENVYPVHIQVYDEILDLALLAFTGFDANAQHHLDFIKTGRSSKVGQVTFCGGFPESAKQSLNDLSFQITRGHFTLIPDYLTHVVSNVTDYGCSGGPCVNHSGNLVGVISRNFGQAHHQTALIPFITLGNFLSQHGFSLST